MSEPKHTNRLIRETSPYLQQHAHNPVDWYPWGEAAFAKAKEENKPVFLSIGYSACHWCHVMERESFENEEIAELMNELYVNIKVDREERPDVDELYMKAVQAMTGSGGWPMSVWLTPEGEPFYGGTYFPPESRHGRPGFVDVLKGLAEVWTNNPERVEQNAEQLTQAIRQAVTPPGGGTGELTAQVLARATDQIVSTFDATYGGFGSAPKFPHPMDLSYLWKRVALENDERVRTVAEVSLDKMARGGIYDQLGGGFHRYSVDERWLIPHFEKMLYDNALLAQTYLDGYLVTGRGEYRRIVEEILSYVQREMTAPGGAFYSTQDADSEGVEGKFFVWTPAEIKQVLGAELGALVADFYGVTEAGNFEHGKSVLWRPTTVAEFAKQHGLDAEQFEKDLAGARQKLFAHREQRVHPGRDEKTLVDWNGLMISAFARAGFHLKQPSYVESARRAAEFCLEEMLVEGRFLRTYKDGKAHLAANLGDYAMFIDGLLDLYQAGFEPEYLRIAKELNQVTLEHFWDDENQGFFFTDDDHEQLIARSKEAYDGATPSAVSVQIGNLFRLAEILGDPELRLRGEETMKLYAALIEQQPRAVSHMISQLSFALSEPNEVVLVAATKHELQPFLEPLRSRLMPERVVVAVTDETRSELEQITNLVEGKKPINGQPAAYICQNFACKAPLTDPAEFAEALP